MKTNTFLLVPLLLGVGVWQAGACEMCAVSAESQAHGFLGKGLFAGLSEQYTHFGTLQDNGRAIPDPARQYLDSSLAQVFLGYSLSPRLSLQFNLPVIYRSFRRAQGFAVDTGSEWGPGDALLLGDLRLYQKLEARTAVSWSLLAGVKFPTGDSSRLGEEAQETGLDGAPPSGIHGHDLALGSGSLDGLIGTALFVRRDRFFFEAGAQYSLRTEGDFRYQYANDVVWWAGPGAYLVRNDKWTLGLELAVSGEHKGEDTSQGARASDTSVTSVYLGPQLNLTWSGKLSAYLAADLPVSIDNSGVQSVPDYRIRAGLSWRF